MGRRSTYDIVPEKKKITPETPPPSYTPPDFEPDGRRPRFMIWGIAIVAVLILFVSISYATSGASVSITPKTKSVDIDDTFSGGKDTTDPSVIPFDLMILKGEQTAKIAVTGTKEEDTKASGKVTLTNNFSSAPQNLKEDTRLLATTGKIYKIAGAIVIPGTKVVAGKTVPGTLDVTVVAENPGPEYNITGPMDYKIFGFKGTPKYDKFSGHSVSGITGGFKGLVPSTGEDAVSRDSLKAKTKDALVAQAKAELPAGFILYDDAIFVNYEDEPIDAPEGATEATLGEKGTLYAFIMDREKMSKAIAQKVISGYDQSGITILNIDKLQVSLKDKEKIIPETDNDISIAISGNATFRSAVDTAPIITDLLGKSRKEFQTILAKYPAVDSAEITIHPFWKNTIPDNPNDIKVTVLDS